MMVNIPFLRARFSDQPHGNDEKWLQRSHFDAAGLSVIHCPTFRSWNIFLPCISLAFYLVISLIAFHLPGEDSIEDSIEDSFEIIAPLFLGVSVRLNLTVGPC